MKTQPIAKALAYRVAHLADAEPPGPCRPEADRFPSSILSALENSLLSGETHYTVRPGMPELRMRIAREIGRLGGPICESADNVLITTGDTESLFLTLLGLRVADGEVVVAPGRFQHHALLGLFNLKARQDSEVSKTEAGILAVYREWDSSDSSQERLVRLAVDRDIPDFLNLRDTIGSKRDPGFQPFSPGRTLVAGNLNALPAAAVFRVGYLLGPEDLLKRIRVWKQATSICCAAPSQRSVLTALTAWQEGVS